MANKKEIENSIQQEIGILEEECKALYKAHQAIQKWRISLGNRFKGYNTKKHGYVEGFGERLDRLFIDEKFSWLVFMTDNLSMIENIEDRIEKRMRKVMRKHPAREFFEHEPGCGPVIQTGLLGLIGSLSNFKRVSNLWSYAGQSVIDGVAVRKTKGEKINWNPHLKELCWKYGVSIVKLKSIHAPRKLYEERKKHELTKSVSAGQADNRARRYVAKSLLKRLWQYGRGLQNINQKTKVDV